MATHTNKPVTTLRCGGIQATIWKNNGEKGPFYNVTVARSYKGPDGAWKNSESFGVAGIEALLVVAAQAKVWITERSAR